MIKEGEGGASACSSDVFLYPCPFPCPCTYDVQLRVITQPTTFCVCFLPPYPSTSSPSSPHHATLAHFFFCYSLLYSCKNCFNLPFLLTVTMPTRNAPYPLFAVLCRMKNKKISYRKRAISMSCPIRRRQREGGRIKDLTDTHNFFFFTTIEFCYLSDCYCYY